MKIRWIDGRGDVVESRVLGTVPYNGKTWYVIPSHRIGMYQPDMPHCVSEDDVCGRMFSG